MRSWRCPRVLAKQCACSLWSFPTSKLRSLTLSWSIARVRLSRWRRPSRNSNMYFNRGKKISQQILESLSNNSRTCQLTRRWKSLMRMECLIKISTPQCLHSAWVPEGISAFTQRSLKTTTGSVWIVSADKELLPGLGRRLCTSGSRATLYFRMTT